MANHTYTGTDVEISYDVKRCIHAAECVKGLPSVFDPDRRPWVDPEGASGDEIADVIQKCPTGALQYRRLDGGSEETAEKACTVHLVGDGPLYVAGPLRVRMPGEDDARAESRVALCRCGQSTNKPFCDNAHQDAAFEASGPIDTDRAISADVEGDGAPDVTVTPHENGPFHFGGVVEMSGDGHQGRARFLEPWLCRCGASKNKPFCDGSHKEIAFEAAGF